MRTPAWLLLVLLAGVAGAPSPAHAQVSDAERAAARDLFRQGDELQRAGKFVDALDKFQRAQKAYSAPTNVLRIAECQAALGQLVEAAESYRAVARTSLPPGSPAAFQAAVEQAKAELSQVEPRIPRLVVQVTPPHAPDPQMWIDGQAVPAALIDEPIPLDPGVHRVRLAASGFSAAEQDATLKERETTTLSFALKALWPAQPLPAPQPVPPRPSLAPVPAPAGGGAPPPPLPPPPRVGPAGAPTSVEAPPPPRPYGAQAEGAVGTEGGAPSLRVGPPTRVSRLGFLFGAHAGWEVAGGSLPQSDGTTVDASTLANQGFAYGLDASFRFARQWLVSLTLEHAGLGHGDLSARGSTDANGSTTLLAASIGFVGHPDRASFYGELGAGLRWLTVNETDRSAITTTTNYNSGELTLGIGVWLAIGRYVRFLPKATLGLGAFNDPSSAGRSSPGHAFGMFGVSGFYNLDL